MEPKILCPQVIHNHLNCTILRTAKNPVIRRHIEQANGTIVLLREYETRIVSVTVNALPNRFSLRGLSHFHSSVSANLSNFFAASTPIRRGMMDRRFPQ
jgi:hypothetical protein